MGNTPLQKEILEGEIEFCCIFNLSAYLKSSSSSNLLNIPNCHWHKQMSEKFYSNIFSFIFIKICCMRLVHIKHFFTNHLSIIVLGKIMTRFSVKMKLFILINNIIWIDILPKKWLLQFMSASWLHADWLFTVDMKPFFVSVLNNILKRFQSLSICNFISFFRLSLTSHYRYKDTGSKIIFLQIIFSNHFLNTIIPFQFPLFLPILPWRYLPLFSLLFRSSLLSSRFVAMRVIQEFQKILPLNELENFKNICPPSQLLSEFGDRIAFSNFKWEQILFLNVSNNPLACGKGSQLWSREHEVVTGLQDVQVDCSFYVLELWAV